MNKIQLRRWKKVSLGLVGASYPSMTAARRTQLQASVEEFFDKLTYNCELNTITDWDGNGGSTPVSLALNDHLEGHRHYHAVTGGEKRNRFANNVSCCVRAGFDLAVKPSAGVVGFTVGDVRAIFNRRIPSWVTEFFGKPLSADIADSEGVWI
jgi:hypothetical protein